jgi:hypothetical protein
VAYGQLLSQDLGPLQPLSVQCTYGTEDNCKAAIQATAADAERASADSNQSAPAAGEMAFDAQLQPELADVEQDCSASAAAYGDRVPFTEAISRLDAAIANVTTLLGQLQGG